ncbi:MAG: pyruvate formate lyase activating enzyme [Thermodesulfobacteriota bacterium]|nr:pyruvate formate lyase activating enzyme [Thermodesulfobacteriota bacterium]
MREALLYERTNNDGVHCFLCRHRCKIDSGKTGICCVRKNYDGTLRTLVYDKIVSTNIDPIEKKPLFHFWPGTASFSIATVGCNFQCSFCQNHSISQMPREQGRVIGEPYSPEEIAEMAVRNLCKTVSYTYTEPTIYYEFAKDTMKAAHDRGLLNVWVTNGYMTPEMLEDAKGLIDAANVDLKAFNDHFYLHYCRARLDGVLDSLKIMKSMGIWIEVTTLLIPTLNDNLEELARLAHFIKSNLGSETPWHVSRFYPRYKEQGIPPTEVEMLRSVRALGMDAGLEFVYTGNVPGEEGEKTLCPECSNPVIERIGYRLKTRTREGGDCPDCGHRIPGHGM